MLPPATFVRGYLVRGFVLWLGIHFGVAGSLAVAGSPPDLFLSVVASALLVVAVYGASAVDTRVCRDDLLLANLGVSPRMGPLLSAAVAWVGEVVLLVIEVAR